jgi:hypothetical protein
MLRSRWCWRSPLLGRFFSEFFGQSDGIRIVSETHNFPRSSEGTEAESGEEDMTSNRIRQIVRVVAIALNAVYAVTTGSSVVMMALGGVPVGAVMMAGLAAIPIVSLGALLWPPERSKPWFSQA